MKNLKNQYLQLIEFNKKQFNKDKKIIEKYLKNHSLFFNNNYCLISLNKIYYLCIISLENKLEIINYNKDIFQIFPYLTNDLYNIKNNFSFSLFPGGSEISGIIENNSIKFLKGYFEI